MSKRYSIIVPIMPQALDFARDLLKHDLTTLSPGAYKVGVFQDDEFTLYRATFGDGVLLELKIVSDKERYHTVPEFHFPDGSISIGQCSSKKDSLNLMSVFQSGRENGNHGYTVELKPNLTTTNFFGQECPEKNAWCARILVADPYTEVQPLIRMATAKFLQTPGGQKILECNCGQFNWGDAVQELPCWLCLKHGFLIEDVYAADEIVDINELLVDN